MDDKTYEDGLGDGAYITLELMLALDKDADDFSCQLGSTIEKMQILGEWSREVVLFWDENFKQDDGPALVDWDEYVEDLVHKVVKTFRETSDAVYSLPNIEEIENHCKTRWEGR